MAEEWEVSSVPPPGPEIAAPADYWCSTDLQILNFSYQWTIKNLEFRCIDDSEEVILESPQFSCGPETSPLHWQLKLTLLSFTSYDDRVDIQLHLMSGSEQTGLRGRHRFFLLGHGRAILHKTEIEIKSGGIESAYLIKRSELFDKTKGFLPDGNLTLLCEISVHDIKKYVDVSARSNPECDLGQQLGYLLETATLSDVTLAVGYKELKAHKNILSARSPVFRAMFQHDTKESKENRVVISDCEPDVVEAMLKFIYTGDVPKLKEMAHDLFIIADKYQLERLKKMCEGALWEKLDVGNAADTLALAVTHNLVQLKRSCIRFITAHISEVMKTEGWGSLKAVSAIDLLAEFFS